MGLAVLVLALALADTPAECADPPSRVSAAYWGYIEACGCRQLSAPSRASAEHSRYLKACAAWRERNRPAVAPAGDPAARAPECGSAPSRVSEEYWDYIEACGCRSLDAPSRSSADYDRYLKACSTWRERHAPLEVPPAPQEAASPAAPPPRR